MIPVSRAAWTIVLAAGTTTQQALKGYEDHGILYLRGTLGSHEGPSRDERPACNRQQRAGSFLLTRARDGIAYPRAGAFRISLQPSLFCAQTLTCNLEAWQHASLSLAEISCASPKRQPIFNRSDAGRRPRSTLHCVAFIPIVDLPLEKDLTVVSDRHPDALGFDFRAAS